MLEHPEEYAALKDKEKDWMSVRFGYFVLLSNKKLEPVDLLTEYFGRYHLRASYFLFHQ